MMSEPAIRNRSANASETASPVWVCLWRRRSMTVASTRAWRTRRVRSATFPYKRDRGMYEGMPGSRFVDDERITPPFADCTGGMGAYVTVHPNGQPVPDCVRDRDRGGCDADPFSNSKRGWFRCREECRLCSTIIVEQNDIPCEPSRTGVSWTASIT